MKITLIGSTSYQDKFKEHAAELRAEGHDVFIPAFDAHLELDELGVCAYNLILIEQADEVHVIWDSRSIGTIFDLGMCFALRKPVKIIYLNPKTFTNFLQKYADFCSFVANTPKEELEKLIKDGEDAIHKPGD